MLFNILYCLFIGISITMFDFHYKETQKYEDIYDEHILIISSEYADKVEKANQDIYLFRPEYVKQIELIDETEGKTFLIKTISGEKYREKTNILLKYIATMNNCEFEIKNLDTCKHSKLVSFFSTAYIFVSALIFFAYRLKHTKKFCSLFMLIANYFISIAVLLPILKIVEYRTRFIEVSNMYNVPNSNNFYSWSLAIYLIKLILIYAIDLMAIIVLR